MRKNITFILLILLLRVNLFAGIENYNNMAPVSIFPAQKLLPIGESIKNFQASLIGNGISKRQANYLISCILFYFETGNKSVLDGLYARKKSFPAIKQYFIDEKNKSLSIVLFNNNIVRLEQENKELKFAFLRSDPVGTLPVEDWEDVISKRDSLIAMYEKTIQEGLTLSDINENMMLMFNNVGAFEEERPLKKDEILFIIASINQYLLDNGFAIDEFEGDQQEHQADPIDFYLSDKDKVYLPFDLSVLPTRISELKSLLEVFESKNVEMEYKIFLARDALSALELEHYYCSMAQVPYFSKAVYQPGQMKKNSYHGGFNEVESLAKTMQLLNRIFRKVVDEMNVEKIEEKYVVQLKNKKRTYPKDETEADPEKFNRLRAAFKKELLNALYNSNNNYIREESLLMLAQLKKVLPRCGKATIVDLNATGKTALYVQALIEIFSDENIVKDLQSKFNIYKDYKGEFLNAHSTSVFLGYGRSNNIGIPKLSHYIDSSDQPLFHDSPWSFEMDNRDAEGEVFFKNNSSRRKILFQAYQSLLLFNAAYEMLDAKGYNDMEDSQYAPEKENTFVNESLSYVNSKLQFMEIYKSNNKMFFPGYLGKQRKQVQEKLNSWFGKEQWQFMYRLPDGSLISYAAGVELYQQAYEKYFDENPDILKNLIKNYRNIYDVSPEHVTDSEKDFQYDFSSGEQVHIQDVAIRRIIRDKGLKFKGQKLLQIRGRKTQGYHLNPGVVPFHKPELINRAISDKMYRKWWNKNSVEDFYQSNRVVVLKKDLSDDTEIFNPKLIGKSS